MHYFEYEFSVKNAASMYSARLHHGYNAGTNFGAVFGHLDFWELRHGIRNRNLMP